MTEQIEGRVPLVIGVTGHRNLLAGEIPELREAVRRWFQYLMREFPDLPLMVMTPVADGADRLAAEVAHEMGLSLCLLLPMPRSLYRADFDADSSREYDRLLALGEVIELPLVAGIAPADIESSQAARDLQYEQLGVYMAAHCHILLALWDGGPSEGAGGTGQVVRFHQQGVVGALPAAEHRSPIDFSEDESDLVYHVVCSRGDGRPPSDGLQPGTASWLTRDDLSPRSETLPDRYRLVFQRMSEFNRDARRYPASGKEPLLPASAAGTPEEARDIEHVYRQAETLAMRFQSRAIGTLRLTYLLVALAGVSFVVYADLTTRDVVIYVYLLIVGTVLGLSWLERRRGWHRRYLDYRHLAEGLRVQFYWAVAGVRMASPARYPHDRLMKRQDLELGWIRNVMRFAARRADSAPLRDDPALLASVIGEWVGDEERGQAGYYRVKALERQRRNRVTQALGALSFAVGLACAVVLAAAFPLLGSNTASVLIALMGLLPYVAAVRQGYAQRVVEREMINQFRHMYRLYGNAYRMLMAAEDMAHKREILRALGDAALEENGLWLLRQRERPASGGQVFQG